MNSAMVSSGIAVSSGSVMALIQWVFSSWGHPVPEAALPVLAAGLVYVGHKVNAILDRKFGVAAAQ